MGGMLLVGLIHVLLLAFILVASATADVHEILD